LLQNQAPAKESCFQALEPIKFDPLKSLCWRYIDHEEDVSTQQRQAKENPRISGEDGDEGWQAGVE
jgi:hypothetical protein